MLKRIFTVIFHPLRSLRERRVRRIMAQACQITTQYVDGFREQVRQYLQRDLTHREYIWLEGVLIQSLADHGGVGCGFTIQDDGFVIHDMKLLAESCVKYGNMLYVIRGD